MLLGLPRLSGSFLLLQVFQWCCLSSQESPVAMHDAVYCN